MTRRLRWTGALILCAAAAACSRAELDAIVGPASGDAGGAGSCPSTPPPVGDTAQTIQVGGIERSYLLHVPATYEASKPAPLLVDLHALAGSGPQERKQSSYPPVADADGALMVFPNGLPGPSGNAWNIGPCCVPNVDDVAFIKAVVVQLRATTCIDAKRIYATGISMGVAWRITSLATRRMSLPPWRPRPLISCKRTPLAANRPDPSR